MTAFDTVTRRLQERTGATGNGSSWPCPAHDDNRPSLSVSQGRDGRVLVNCHAGCAASDVLAALDLTMADLFDGTRTNGARRVEDARYHYHDENGVHLCDLVRSWTDDGKTFRQQAADGTWSTKAIRKVPYRLPEVLAHIAAGGTVVIVEGEKDVHALERAGCVATTNPGGAGKWRSDYNRWFTGARILVIADNDKPGRAHARDVARHLRHVAASIEVARSPHANDIADHLAAGHALDDIVDLDDQADDDGDQTDDEDGELSTWRPVDLADAIAGRKSRPSPTILRRSDGKCLFYPGQINYLHGADGVGKSFVALFAALFLIKDGRHVVWLDWEDPDEVTVVARLLDLGATTDDIRERFHYFHPDTEATPTAIADLCDYVTDVQAELVVVDSIGEAFAVDGVDENADKEVTPWLRRVLKPLAVTGAGVLPIDHGIKNTDATNKLHPSGSKRKRAQVTGSAFLVEAPRPISQEYGGGQLVLITAKDRHGNFTRGKPAAVIDVAIYPDGGWSVHVHPPTVAAADPAENDKALARAMVRAVQDLTEETGKPVSMHQAEQTKRVKASNGAKRAALEYARDLGALNETEGPRRSRLFSYVKDLDT